MVGCKISSAARVVAAISAAFLSSSQQCFSFQIKGSHKTALSRTSILSSSKTDEPSTTTDPTAIELKASLSSLAAITNRGFSASRSDRDKAKSLINNLSKYSLTDEPASAYYAESRNIATESGFSLSGNWRLIYTDAPDITSLDAGPFSTAKLGRIGQECNPPSIKNIIEWERPSWAASLPFSGKESSRVLQKVCTEGTATPDNPKAVDLKIVGLELEGISGDNGNASDGGFSLLRGPASLLENNPVSLRGPLSAPFGKFEILYLDNDMRITKTYQGFYTVNIREDDEWF